MATPNFPAYPDQSSWSDDDIIAFQEKFQSFSGLHLKAQKRAIEDKLTQYYKKLLDEEQYEHFDSGAICALKTLHKTKQLADNITDVKQGKNPYCFYTINFKPEKATEDFIEDIDKELKDFTSKCKYLTESNYMYSIEQRSEESDPVSGLHVHILFDKKENSPSKLQRAFQNRFFDKWIGTPAALDYRYVSEGKRDDKVQYILGIKEKGKMAKVEKDKKVKTAHGIPLYYEKGYASIIKTFV